MSKTSAGGLFLAEGGIYMQIDKNKKDAGNQVQSTALVKSVSRHSLMELRNSTSNNQIII